MLARAWRPRRAESLGWSSRARDPAATRKGTTRLKAPGGVDSSSTAPIAPPTAVTQAQRRSKDAVPCSSGREARAEPGQQAVTETMFATLAGKAGMPRASRAG